MVKKTDKPENKDDDTGFSPKQQNFIKSLFGGENGIFSKPENLNSSGLSNDDYKQLESMKWILSMIYNKDFIKSATNLPEDELDDINDALMINSYADCPELAEWIDVRFELARSRIANHTPFDNVLKLLSRLSDKTGIAFNNVDVNSGILGKLK